MKKTNKAVLLSLMVFPGAGQIFLKRYVLGLVLILICSYCLYIMIATIWLVSETLSNDILSGKIQPNLSAIVAAVKNAMSLLTTPEMLKVKIIMGVCWVLSGIHAYWLGKKLEEAQNKSE